MDLVSVMPCAAELRCGLPDAGPVSWLPQGTTRLREWGKVTSARCLRHRAVVLPQPLGCQAGLQRHSDSDGTLLLVGESVTFGANHNPPPIGNRKNLRIVL